MTTLSVRLPDSLHQQVKLLSKQDGVSINQFIASALAEKMSALLTEAYLRERQPLGSSAAFLAALDKVADCPPDTGDQISD